MFELARGLWPIEIGNKNGDVVALVKNDARLTCTDKVSSSFLCVLALSSVICQPIHLFHSTCGFIKYTVSYVSSEPLHPNDICLYCSKASSDLTDTQLYFLIKNIYKPNKTFDFPETDQHFRFV